MTGKTSDLEPTLQLRAAVAPSIENEFIPGRLRCFICGRETDRDEVLLLDSGRRDLACLCKKHLKNFGNNAN